MNYLRGLGVVFSVWVSWNATMIQEIQAAEVTAGTDIATAYVWRGITFNDEGVIQPSVTVTHPAGFAFNVWANYDLGNFDDRLQDNDFSEVDLTFSYTLDLSPVSLTVGHIEYLFPNAGSDTATGEIYGSAGIELVEGITFTGAVYVDYDEVNDVYGTIGLSVDVGALVLKLPAPWSLSFSSSIGFAGREFVEAYGGEGSGAYDWNLGLTLGYAFNDSLSMSLFIRYVDNFDDEVLLEQEADWYGGVGIYYSF